MAALDYRHTDMWVFSLCDSAGPRADESDRSRRSVFEAPFRSISPVAAKVTVIASDTLRLPTVAH